ncbi:MAG: hypothetical protein Q4C56_04025 [Peptococcaceae bacterium]|nr:hypothetical protein [Peptococcaceae bacterium]
MNSISPEQLTHDIQKGSFKPNIYLTNLSMAYFQDASRYVAKNIFPICPVKLSSARYYTFAKEDLLRDNVARKPQFGKVQPAQMGQADQSYACQVDQVIVGIDQIEALDYQRTNAPGSADPRKAKVKFIAEQMNLHQDIVFAENFFAPGIWGNEWSGAAAYDQDAKTFIKFNDDNCDPVLLIDDLCTDVEQNTGRRPNRLALGKAAFNALKAHPGVVERVKFGGSTANPATVNERVLAELFGIERVVVMSSIYNKAGFGTAGDMQFICDPTSALLAYATNTPAIDEPSAGYIFTWDMLGNGQYMPTVQYAGENGTHSEFVEGLFAADMKKTADDLAVFLKDCV